jgi:hypothetical protein
MKILKILIILAIAAALMACSFTVNVPTVRTGVTQTFAVDETPGSSSETSSVNIEMGAGKLNLSAGTDKLIEGEILFNIDDWKPVLTRGGNSVTISQEHLVNVGIPEGSIKNNWNLKIGPMPLELSLSSGAYEGDLDLSGLSITKLSIADGASESKVRFDTLNPVDMSLFSYKTGASDVTITGLANANVDQVTFDSGVGSFELDFSGELKKDLDVSIKSGMSDVKLILPADKHVKVLVNGGLKEVRFTGTWTVYNNAYEFGTDGPVINIVVDMAVGSLQLIKQ